MYISLIDILNNSLSNPINGCFIGSGLWETSRTRRPWETLRLVLWTSYPPLRVCLLSSVQLFTQAPARTASHSPNCQLFYSGQIWQVPSLYICIEHLCYCPTYSVIWSIGNRFTYKITAMDAYDVIIRRVLYLKIILMKCKG